MLYHIVACCRLNKATDLGRKRIWISQLNMFTRLFNSIFIIRTIKAVFAPTRLVTKQSRSKAFTITTKKYILITINCITKTYNINMQKINLQFQALWPFTFASLLTIIVTIRIHSDTITKQKPWAHNINNFNKKKWISTFYARVLTRKSQQLALFVLKLRYLIKYKTENAIKQLINHTMNELEKNCDCKQNWTITLHRRN